MKFIQSLLAVSFALILTACTEPEVATGPEEIVRPAKIFQVKDISQQYMRNFPAEVEAHQGSFLAFRVNGQLSELKVLPGQKVEKDQLLARLAPEDFQLQVDDREARFELAKSQFNRTEKLLKQNLASEAQYDEARANMLVAESVYKKALTDLQYTELHAPFAGTISQKFVENFENIQAKQNIFFLQNQQLLDVSIRVPERIVARVQKDRKYQPSVVFDGFPEQSYLLTVREWDSKADPTTLTYKVVFTLPRPEGFNLLPGMTGNVKIDLSKIMATAYQGYVVPLEAVLSVKKNQGYVWKFDRNSGNIEKVNVEIGNIHRNGIEVLSGITSGDEIVAAGGHYLKAGTRVRPWSREQGL